MNYSLVVFEFEFSPSVIVVAHQKNSFANDFRYSRLIVLR